MTDLYELTMATAYLAEGIAEREATFSLFVRSLPPQRGYLVAAGLESVLDYLGNLRFGDEDLAAPRELGLFEESFLDYLAQLRFGGTLRLRGEVTVGDEGAGAESLVAPEAAPEETRDGRQPHHQEVLAPGGGGLAPRSTRGVVGAGAAPPADEAAEAPASAWRQGLAG